MVSFFTQITPTYTFQKLPALLVLLLVCSFVNAQDVKYVTDPSYLQAHNSASSTFENKGLDTTIRNFQNYYPRNTNGHFGVPSASLLLKYTKRSMGFKLYDLPYANDLIRDEDVLFYQTKGPYASLTGIAGTRKEEWFRLLFSHSFKNKVNLTVVFNRYGGIGFYKRQQSFTNNFYTSSNYTSSNGRAGYNAYFLFNKLKHQENGGIKNDTAFLNKPTITKELLPVNISAGRRTNRQMSVYANPWLRLNKTEDSTTLLSHFIDYEFRYHGDFYSYNDQAPASDGFYKVFYLDTTRTHDSTHVLQFHNGINYTLRINPLKLTAKIGYANEYTIVHQHNDSLIQNNLLLTNVTYTRKRYVVNLNSHYVATGSNKQDYQVELANNLMLKGPSKWKDPIILSLKLMSEQRHPDYIYNQWYSNHFIWNKSFTPVQTQQAQLDFYSRDLWLSGGAMIQNIKNYLFFNSLARSDQYDGTIQNMSFYLKKDLLIAKHLGFDNSVTYQYTSDTNVVRIPSWAARSALYYQGNLFRKSLWLQIGFQGEYYSRFTSYAYMPATNVYYLQSTNRAGNYPFIDFFLTARIKPVRFFVKIDHVFQGLLGTNYSLGSGYLQADRTFKFGVNWVFFD
ncbi:MAG: hypothetical protein JST26_02175 [Bacteroidetes bacterium]|nr:hypothetical protein [Bacteroidota bacterium]